MNGAHVYQFETPHGFRGIRAATAYVNVVPGYSCPNRCRFCGRIDAVRGIPNIYEKKAGGRLWLAKAPAAEAIIGEIRKQKTQFLAIDEIAFVGLGEPLLQFRLVMEVAGMARAEGFRGKIRVDTNGLVKCWRDGDPAQELKDAGVDEARISVNAINNEEYALISRPRHKQAFGALCGFVKDCLEAGIRTSTSFVVDFDDGEVKTRAREEYFEFAQSLGVKPENVIFREYVGP